MPSVAIGICVHAELENLRLSIESVRSNTGISASLLLLPDGPEPAMQEFLATCELPQLPTKTPMGAPACLNRLVRNTDADILVLLESGCVVGLGWLERLLQALDSRREYALAGPSTNRSWNEQGVGLCAEPTPAHIATAAAQVAARFGSKCKTLEPLYSLADFCYLVRREVFAAIGDADEAYGLGPCWEMDFNIRAARAGFQGVWACGSYVYRCPPTSRRQRAEAELFEQNKQRYQSKFCARQLQDSRAQFRSHCRGDACPNFARHIVSPGRLPTARPAPLVQVETARDLVTCIMPTRNRREWVRRSIDCFLAQDYAERELLIVDDGDDAISDLVPADARIIYKRVEGAMVLGAKRNLACTQARGTLIAHWDDDDWYPAWRLSRQVKALSSANADLCGSSELYYIDETEKKAFGYAYSNKRPWVAGNTLLYRRSFWHDHRFQEIQVGEDTRFVWMASPDRILDLKNQTICIGSIHPSNTSRKVVAGCWWKPVSFSEIQALTQPSSIEPSREPMVSCIMPTRDRREFLKLSLQSFKEQDYPSRELIVVDDGSARIQDLLQEDPAIQYVRLNKRASIGEKRNIACSMARGEIIAHWDDDDWYGRSRIRAQVRPLLRGAADLTGLHNSHILCLPQGEFWGPSDKLHRTMFVGNVHGGTLVYWTRIWERGIRYPHTNLAEDAVLIRQSVARGNRIEPIEDSGLFIYVRHGRNAWAFEPGRFIDPAGWTRTVAPCSFSQELLRQYQGAALSFSRT